MKNSRRKFLGDTVKATLAFTIVPRFVLGGKGYTSPSDKLNLGFIGTGKQARGLLHAFADKAQVIAGADVDSKKLALFQSLAEKAYAGGTVPFKGFKSYADFREMLERKDLDAVVVATPDHWHAVAAIYSANAGKHVYCEKPLAHSVEEGRAMVNAMHRNKVILQTGSMQRSWKNFRQAASLVRNGYIGNIKEIVVNVGEAAIPCDLPTQPVPTYLNWDAWLGPAPVRGYNAILSPPVEEDVFPRWRAYKEFGGGVIADWGAHMFDIAQWALGMDNSGPVQFIPPEAKASKGMVMLYQNGVRMKHDDFGRGFGVRFIGEKGTINISREYLDSDPANLVSATIQPGEIHLYESNDHYTDWLDCIKSGKQPICDVETGHRTSSLCCLMNIGYWQGATLNWDPVNEKITNNEAANKLLKADIHGKWKLK